MKFQHKVYDHKRKAGIDFGCFGSNSLGIRGQKGGPNKHYSWFSHHNFSISKYKSMKF